MDIEQIWEYIVQVPRLTSILRSRLLYTYQKARASSEVINILKF
jgi:hypothetical protein